MLLSVDLDQERLILATANTKLHLQSGRVDHRSHHHTYHHGDHHVDHHGDHHTNHHGDHHVAEYTATEDLDAAKSSRFIVMIIIKVHLSKASKALQV